MTRAADAVAAIKLPRRSPPGPLAEKMMKLLHIIIISLLLMSCGPMVSGTWSDDPKNWSRAFGEASPGSGISVVHSWYMRTPHFTAEYAWFFELKLNEKSKKELISNPELSKLKSVTPDDLRQRIYQEPPKWFQPEPLSSFEVYESKADNHFLMFIDKNGGRSFWTNFQL